MSATLSWNSSAPARLRAGAGIAVVALHAAVVGAIAYMGPDVMPVSQPETVSVRFVELAPVVQTVAAPPAPTPPAPKPEAKPETKPKVEPKPKPVVQPKKPEPTPDPLPVSESAISAPPAPPVEAPAPAVASKAPPSGSPDASDRPASPAAPPSDQPRLIGQIDYAGQPPNPVYPRVSQRMREEGEVIVRVLINPRGRVDRATVQKSSGYSRLDESAVDAAKHALFKPYTENGVAFAALADIPFNFKVKD